MKIRHESEADAIIAREGEMREVKGEIVMRKLITPSDGADRYVLLIGEYGPDSAALTHGHDFDHLIYILSGSLSIDTAGENPEDGKKTLVRQGDVVFIPRGEIHGFSTGPYETCRMLIAVPIEAMDEADR